MEMSPHDGVTNNLLILEKYQIALGIQDKRDDSPFALVSIKAAEDLLTNGLLENTYVHLIKSGLPEKTNMSIEELLALPTWKLRALYRAHVTVKKLSSNNVTQDQLKKLMKSLGEV
jgi:hypothetical protein